MRPPRSGAPRGRGRRRPGRGAEGTRCRQPQMAVTSPDVTWSHCCFSVLEAGLHVLHPVDAPAGSCHHLPGMAHGSPTAGSQA